MGVLDFLFQGSPPPATTTYGSTVTGIPQFMSDYTLGLLNRANAVAAEPYQAYSNPRLAEFTPEQQSAFNLTQQSVGAFNQPVQTGINLAQSAVANNNASAAAQPYLTEANQTAPGVINNYMNPYTSNVVNRLGELGARNLQENLAPGIMSNFIRSGQYGSTGQQSAVGKALRDTQESTLAAQNQALNTGYGQGLSAAQADLARQGNLGQVAGNLASQTATNQLSAAGQLGNLANVGQGVNLKDLAALEAVGQTQQQQDQKNLDLAYQDFAEQRAYPAQQLSMLNSLVRGLPYSTSTNTTGTGPASTYQASPLSQIAGAASLYNALSGVKAAKGGAIKVRNKNRRSSRGRRK